MDNINHNVTFKSRPILIIRDRATLLYAQLSTRPWLYQPLIAFGITRLIVLLGAYLAAVALPSQTGDGYWHVVPDNLFLDVWARWDSGFYLGIVKEGYFYIPGQMGSVAFFPLYPLLVNLLSLLVGNHVLAGVIISHLSLLGALIFLYRLTELEFGDQGTAQRVVYYIAAFPSAFFFSAVYTESTFLLVSVATIYFARRQMWGWAGVMGMLTSATRIIGVVVWGVVMLEWLRHHGWTLLTIHRKASWMSLYQGLQRDWPSVIAMALIPLGLLSYMLFLYIHFHDPLAFWSVQEAWGREDVGPAVTVWYTLHQIVQQNYLTGQIYWHLISDMLALIMVLSLSIPVWRRLGAGYALYSMFGVLIPASSGTGSMLRYALVLFPVFMILAHWGQKEPVDRAISIGFTLFLGILTAIFVNWIFVA